MSLTKILLLAVSMLFVSCEWKQAEVLPAEPRNIEAHLTSNAVQNILQLRNWENMPGREGKWRFSKHPKTGDPITIYHISQSELEFLEAFTGGYEVISPK